MPEPTLPVAGAGRGAGGAGRELSAGCAPSVPRLPGYVQCMGVGVPRLTALPCFRGVLCAHGAGQQTLQKLNP